VTDEQRKAFQDLQRRKAIGYAEAERLRYERVKETSTMDAIASLRRAFQLAAESMPARPSSGLVEFYQALSRSL
jgi:hypothetical protein